MKPVLLEDVYCDSGVPQYTFVEPSEYTKTKIALRTKGRGVVVEGPSGIGKTTCIKKILEDIGVHATCLSARKADDIECVELLLQSPYQLGTIIVDDFHLLDDEIKKSFSDLLKVLADEAREDVKLVLIGINRAGECLIQLAPDLNNRVDTIKFESNPDDKIKALIEKGEKVLNVSISCRDEIISKSYGSFHIAQMLCKTICIAQNITESQLERKIISTSINTIVSIKMQELSRVFEPTIKTFAAGNRNRRDGRSPYLRLLIWLSESDNGAVQMTDICMLNPRYKASINQISDKGYITQLINKNDNIGNVLFYEPTSRILAIEDPKFVFYIKNTDWLKFAKEMGFKINEDVKAKFDFALSFAGERRVYAEMLYQKLTENEYSVFYDKDMAADILGKDLDKYFAPIYEADATYVIAMIDSNYPKKVWTVFESDKYKDRFGQDAVIPILFEDFSPSPMDALYNKGYDRIDSTKGNIEEQVDAIVNRLIEKMNQ